MDQSNVETVGNNDLFAVEEELRESESEDGDKSEDEFVVNNEEEEIGPSQIVDPDNPDLQ